MKFIRSIGKCYVNGIGFDLYENKNKSATIRPTKIGGYNFPKKYWKKFKTLDDANRYIDAVAEASGATSGAQLVQALKERLL